MNLFARLVTALDRDKAEQIARIEAQIDTSGMNRAGINRAIITADGNGTGKHSASIRIALIAYVQDVL